MLNALKQMDFDHFEGIVEIDETYFLYSQKGQRGITERKPRKRGSPNIEVLATNKSAFSLSKII